MGAVSGFVLGPAVALYFYKYSDPESWIIRTTTC